MDQSNCRKVTHPLGLYGIYCLCPWAQAVYPIQPSWAWYNYYIYIVYMHNLPWTNHCQGQSYVYVMGPPGEEETITTIIEVGIYM